MTTAPDPRHPSPDPGGAGLERTLGRLHRLEDLLIAALLMGTLGLALFQIVLRNTMGTGIIWGDALVRVLVLWIGMAGAMAATRERKHINIDVLTRFLPPALRRVADGLTTAFAAAVCLVACGVSLRFVWFEYTVGDLAFGRVPFWVCELILPLGFAVIALRYLIQLVVHLRGSSRKASR